MDWSSIIIGVGSAGGALGLNEVIRAIVNKWANKQKDEMDAEQKMFATFSEINEKLASEMSELTQKLIESHSKTAEVINHKITLTMENSELLMKNKQLEAQNELLRKENVELKKSLNEFKEKQDKMERQIKELSSKV